MPVAATRAFVLGSSIFSEQDKLVHLLTEKRGMLKAIAPGALKHRNRFGALLELFTEGDFQYYWKEDRDMITLSKGDILTSNFNIVSQPENIFYCYLVAEILLRFIPYDHRDKRIYRLVRAMLESRTAGIAMDLLMLYFQVWILRIEGMMFKTGICSNCNARDFEPAWLRTDFRGLLCRKCHSDEPLVLNTTELQFLAWTEKGAPKDLGVWDKEKLDRPQLIRIFKEKIEHHGELNLKSTQYLKEFK